MADTTKAGELTDAELDQVAGGIAAGEPGDASSDDGASSDTKKGGASSNLLNACCSGTHLASVSVH